MTDPHQTLAEKRAVLLLGGSLAISSELGLRPLMERVPGDIGGIGLHIQIRMLGSVL